MGLRHVLRKAASGLLLMRPVAGGSARAAPARSSGSASGAAAAAAAPPASCGGPGGSASASGSASVAARRAWLSGLLAVDLPAGGSSWAAAGFGAGSPLQGGSSPSHTPRLGTAAAAAAAAAARHPPMRCSSRQLLTPDGGGGGGGCVLGRAAAAAALPYHVRMADYDGPEAASPTSLTESPPWLCDADAEPRPLAAAAALASGGGGGSPPAVTMSPSPQPRPGGDGGAAAATHTQRRLQLQAGGGGSQASMATDCSSRLPMLLYYLPEAPLPVLTVKDMEAEVGGGVPGGAGGRFGGGGQAGGKGLGRDGSRWWSWHAAACRGEGRGGRRGAGAVRCAHRAKGRRRPVLRACMHAWMCGPPLQPAVHHVPVLLDTFPEPNFFRTRYDFPALFSVFACYVMFAVCQTANITSAALF